MTYYNGTGAFSGLDGSTAGYILTSNGTGIAPSFQANAAIVQTWTDISGTTTVTNNTNYFVTAASTLTLPASPSQGSMVRFIVDTASSVVITANTGQTIRLSSNASSVAGTFTNSLIGDAMNLVYRTTGAVWIATSFVGAWIPA